MTELSATDVWASDCPDDIYDAESAEEWVRCKQKRNMWGMIIGAMIIVIIALILLLMGGTAVKVFTVLITIALLGAMAAAHFWWVPRLARAEYSIYDRDVTARATKEGMTKQEAARIVRETRERKDIFGRPGASQQQSASMQMAASGMQMFSPFVQSVLAPKPAPAAATKPV
jgi:hypothetical protein